MYFNNSHFATSKDIEEMNARIHGDGRTVATVFGRASAINRWIVKLTNCDELDKHSKLVRWTYINGVVFIYYWGNTWGWRALMRRMEEMPSDKVTVTSLIDWELASNPS
jgi:heme/copper-type cytochrome/quinol oxidase subunit 1